MIDEMRDSSLLILCTCELTRRREVVRIQMRIIIDSGFENHYCLLIDVRDGGGVQHLIQLLAHPGEKSITLIDSSNRGQRV